MRQNLAAAQWLKQRAQTLGLAQLHIAPVALAGAEKGLNAWLDAGFQGTMDYMSRGPRAATAHIFPAAQCALIVALPYLTPTHFQQAENNLPANWRDQTWAQVHAREQGYVSLYARGRDYHKVMRRQLKRLMNDFSSHFATELGADFAYRIVVDSAPLMEVELAHRAGLGLRGKHTLLLRRKGGSLFFLAEVLLNRALPLDPAESAAACGQCQKCLEICPTQAIIAPYRLDARRCISYLTIENKGAIPLAFRRAIGQRVYGCDDCQLVCPWNKFAQMSRDVDFAPRAAFQSTDLLTWCAWTETDFLHQTEGSAIRRIGFRAWQRNLAVVAGNALRDSSDAVFCEALRQALQQAFARADAMVREHIVWALSA